MNARLARFLVEKTSLGQSPARLESNQERRA